MKKIPKAIFCWSGGKDSALCLHKTLSEKTYDVKYLLTTVNGNFNRISMHGVREELVEMQAQSIGIELIKVIVKEGSNSEYENQMEAAFLKAKQEGVEHVIYGDIFLEDLRAYRQKHLAKIGMKGVFPLWKEDTSKLINEFIDKGFKTVTCCVNDGYLSKEWSGIEVNKEFVNCLPLSVDPCGEKGEYHTFCYEGPIFKKPINFKIGEIIYKGLEIKTNDDVCALSAEIKTKGFWFCDLIPE